MWYGKEIPPDSPSSIPDVWQSISTDEVLSHTATVVATKAAKGAFQAAVIAASRAAKHVLRYHTEQSQQQQHQLLVATIQAKLRALEVTTQAGRFLQNLVVINAITIAEYVECMATNHLAQCLVAAIDSLPQARQVLQDEQLALRLSQEEDREEEEEEGEWTTTSVRVSYTGGW